MLAVINIAHARCPILSTANITCTQNNPSKIASVLTGNSIQNTNNRIHIYNNGNSSININVTNDINIDPSTTTTDISPAILAENEETATDININTQNINSAVDAISVSNKGSGYTVINTGDITSDNLPVYIDVGKNAKDITVSTNNLKSPVGGIVIANHGIGSSSVYVNGNINTQNNAISVNNDVSSKNVLINANNINSVSESILVNNQGTGSTTITTGNINSSNSQALVVKSGKNTQDIYSYNGNVAGLTGGIDINNGGTGSVTVNTGNVKSDLGSGISVYNDLGSKDINIYAHNIEASNFTTQAFGITANNYGTGSTTIVVNGSIKTGERGTGIWAVNGRKTKDLTIIAGNINSNTLGGIFAVNAGAGSTTVIAKDITADSGLVVANGVIAKDLMLQANNVTGGVEVANEGIDGSTTVILNNIYSKKVSALSVGSSNKAKDLIIHVNDAIGSFNTIDIFNSGTGSTFLTTTGNVITTKIDDVEDAQHTTYNGIKIRHSKPAYELNIIQLAGNITGINNGIYTDNQGSGDTNIHIAGKVSGGVGAGIKNTDASGINTNITLENGAEITANSGIAIMNNDSNANIIVNKGARISGQVLLNNGSDTFTINQADTSALTLLDGGKKDADGLNPDGQKDIDTLNINSLLTGSSASNGDMNNTALRNWNIINVGQQGNSPLFGNLALTGDLETRQLNINTGSILNFAIPKSTSLQTGTVDLSRQINITADVNNAGTISFNNNYSGDILTINGNYNGSPGSQLLMDIDSHENTADKLLITGDATGRSTIKITDIKGLGADTSGTNGIALITVKGKSNDAIFSLFNGHIDAGAYAYELVKNNDDSSWYLRSDKQTFSRTANLLKSYDIPEEITTRSRPLYRKEVPLFAAVASQLRQADSLMLANMHQRIGSTPLPDERMSWGRVIASRTDIQQNGPANARTTGNYAGLQLGSDIWSNNGWRAGGYVGYLHGNLDVDGFTSGIDTRAGKNTTKSYFIGAYGNYTRENGAYADFVIQGARHHVDIKPDNNPSSKQKGHGVTASVEIGQPFTLGSSNWKLEPQAQIIHQWLDLNDSDISGRTTVSHGHNNAWLFRLGGRLEGSYQLNKGSLRPYARVNFFYSPDGADHTSYVTNVATTRLNAGASYASTELAIGGTYDITNKVKAYGEIGHTWSNGGDAHTKAPVNGSVGLKINW
ncbi:autotransporter outer membrane beta-barrel domain-containing protein [Snodgrassella alvi]|uniref:autotransporter outer membrane beta-barrel domain-containing protein n=1 Tax=Snodgrassella alvi TaxID=1196083 RepID=UPI00351C5C67